MTEKCVVKQIKNSIALVELEKTSKCEGCNACHFGSNSKITRPAIIDVDCCEGDEVLVAIPENAPVIASLILFVIPLVLFFAGLMAGYFINELVMIAFAIVCMTGGFFLAHLIDKKIKSSKKYMPVIIEKI